MHDTGAVLLKEELLKHFEASGELQASWALGSRVLRKVATVLGFKV